MDYNKAVDKIYKVDNWLGKFSKFSKLTKLNQLLKAPLI